MMPIFLSVAFLAVFLIVKAIVSYRKSYTFTWNEGLRMGVGAYWLLALLHVLYFTDFITINECLTTSQQFIWPGIILTLSIMISNDLIAEKKVEAHNDGNTRL
jgi:isoprenylcysteine carboxyl methyltransferase (ICMT) family protein YpbQ